MQNLCVTVFAWNLALNIETLEEFTMATSFHKIQLISFNFVCKSTIKNKVSNIKSKIQNNEINKYSIILLIAEGWAGSKKASHPLPSRCSFFQLILPPIFYIHLSKPYCLHVSKLGSPKAPWMKFFIISLYHSISIWFLSLSNSKGYI